MNSAKTLFEDLTEQYWIFAEFQFDSRAQTVGSSAAAVIFPKCGFLSVDAEPINVQTF